MFRNIRKEKELIDREMLAYFNEKKNEVDQRMIAFETKCATDTAGYEHTYHHAMEVKGIEIAKLEALKEVMENDVNTYKELLEQKDKEIARMAKIVSDFAKNQASVQIVK